jgi:4-hydroxybenzoate polyprenyltransferase
MSAVSLTGAFLTRVLTFLVDSTMFGAVGISAITYATIILTRNPFSWPLVMLPFFACLMIYSLNRITDRTEDAINLPDRARFPHTIRVTLLVVSLVCYVLLLGIVFQTSVLCSIIAVVPGGIAILYSVFRLKRIFIIKNVSIATALGASVLVVPAYYGNWTGGWEMLFVFFFLILLTNTILFDIKDIRGDRACGIHTLPVMLGISATRSVCGIIVAGALIMIIPLYSMNRESVLLVPYAITMAFSTIYAPEGEHPPWWFYGLLVDGEMWILLFSTLIVGILR